VDESVQNLRAGLDDLLLLLREGLWTATQESVIL
jgi:hypothetical protein